MKSLLLVVAAIVLGINGNKLDSRIVNGFATTIDKFPYVAIIKINTQVWVWNKQCTGTIIGKRLILTAAHCLLDHNDKAIPERRIRVQVGSTSSMLRSQGSVFNVRSYQIHPGFKTFIAQRYTHRYKAYNAYDIAVLELEACMNYTMNIQSISHFAAENPPTNETAAIIGWGAKSPFNTNLTSTLQYQNVTVISTDECASLTNRDVDMSQICTYERATGLCIGDTGSPLVNNTFPPTLLGIFSYTPPWQTIDGQVHDFCGLEPDIYVSIAQVLPFISSYFTGIPDLC